MKKATLYSFVVLASLLAICIPGASHAAPVGNSNWAADYLIAADDLSRLTLGLYYDAVERDVKDGGMGLELQSDRVMTYLGFEVLPWLVPYVTVGEAENDLKGFGTLSDSSAAWGGGVKLNLADHDILDPMLMEDRLRLRGSVDYLRVSLEDGREDLSWNEWHVALTLGIVNDTTGNKRFSPQSIELFGGPIYSAIDGDIESDDEFGFTLGLSLHCTERVTLDVAIEDLEQTSTTFGVHIRL